MSATLCREAASLLSYELVGAPGAPVILALGGISATRHVASGADDPSPGWWEGIVGTGRALDTSTRRVLSVDYLDGGRAADGRPASRVTTHDQATAIVALLDDIGIDRLDAVVGASYGGMVALALAERWPERVDRVIAISAAHAPHPMATALRAVQRGIVELGLDTGRGTEAMVLARELAMTTYRSAREFGERFGGDPASSASEAEFPVERYLRRAGERFAGRMRPERFLALSLSADLHRVLPEAIAVPTTLVAAQGDRLVPESQLRALAGRLPNLRALVPLRSRRGHDAFLTETTRLGRILTTQLAD